MKKILLLIIFTLFCVGEILAQAKYVFYFIGDGMGVNQVNATEMYKAEVEGKIGTSPLLFTQFPIAGLATTYSASNGVADSAAGSTALATGVKTKNGGIGVDTTMVNPVVSVAEMAKKRGMKVGVCTSVSIDHATPSSFYAHQANRNMNYEIALDLIKSQFDFFGGAGFLKPNTRYDKTEPPSIFPMMEKAGYTLVYGYDDYQVNGKDKDKVILMNNKGVSMECLPYAIDRKEGDLTLAQITECAINTLEKENDQGFFLAIEGGQIDWACHANDAATTFHEIVDLEEAIKVAYNFYLQHPNETLIVVTADHETGGIALGTGSSTLNLKVLQYQKMSQGTLSSYIKHLRKNKKNDVSWIEMKEFLGEHMGLWKEIPMSESQEKVIFEAYENSFVKGDLTEEKLLYQSDVKLAAVAEKVLNEIARVGWMSGSHSAGYVPVFAIGNNSDLFKGKMDNIDIPKKNVKAAEY